MKIRVIVRRLTYPPIDSLTEPTFSDMMQRRSDAVRPDELFYVEVFLISLRLVILNTVLNDKHLRGVN